MHHSPTTGRRLSLILLTAAALTFAGCGESPDSGAAASGPATTTVAAGPDATPAAGPPISPPAGLYSPAAATPRIPRSAGALSFNRTEHDFGKITDTQRYNTSFAFTNAGSETIVIREVKSACGCTVPTLAKYEYAPGEHGIINVQFDPKGKQGKTDKILKVITDAKSNPVTELRITSMIRPILQFERIQRFGRLRKGKVHRKIVTIRYTDPDLVIGNITVNDPYITPALVESGAVESDGDEIVYRADIELTVAAEHPWGPLFAKQLSIPVTGKWEENAPPRQQTFSLFLLGQVYGEISASRTVVSLSQLKRGQQFTRSFELTREGGLPFKINAATARVGLEGIRIRTENLGPGKIRVFVEGAVPANFRGSIRGQIELITNVPGEELLGIPVNGFVQ